MRLSVSMIVKNEAECIARALHSARMADEIVILDTGSTDDTAGTVARLGLPNVRFIAGEYAWQDDFAHARNAALARCTGDWALVLDADDWLEAGALAAIRAACAASPPDRKCLLLEMVNSATDGGWKSYRMPRVFRLGAGVAFHRPDHEVPNVDTAADPVARMMIGRSPAHAADPDRSLRILTKARAADPADTRTLYYLGREYWARRDFAKAVPVFVEYLGKSRFQAERADACLYLARMYWLSHKGDAAREWCMRALTINADFREAIELMAEMSFPANAARWRAFAAGASNRDVLFVR